ncbi:Flap endonuclease GEN homolog 1 [Rhizoctonia solani AG-1 IB]|uniref:Flap endonuclease GEN homolog 1 n=2 Tax=Thanatephorus cucumeris (strain AG1-IB / isolate 7/3/14) TaxID=1108050 RepID=M5CA93_THACB|nr:Flap endonuclease GEN homolog 1 [Rhizoctonia solani AG-1 IB]
MGVPGLWDIIRHTGKSEALAQLALEGFRRDQAVKPVEGLPPGTSHPRALRIGIDASIWFFHAAYGREGENPELRTLFFRLARLASYTFCPLFVFDGPQRPRHKRGKTINTRMNSLAPGMKNMIAAFGFEWRTAPGEAEAELAYLNSTGVIDAILSDDVDNFLFGARVVIRNPSGTLTGNRGYPALNRDGKDDGVHVMVYRMDDIESDPACKLTRGGMILIGLLSGGDYDLGAKRCGPKTALALAQRGLGDELLDAFETLSRERFIDYIPAWKAAVVEALRSGCANLEGDDGDAEDSEEESQETVVTASQGSKIPGSQSSAKGGGKDKAPSKGKKKKPPAKRQPALAAALAASDFPDIAVLEDYCAPWTSQRAFLSDIAPPYPSSSHLDEDDALPASQGSVVTSSQTSTKSASRSKKKQTKLTANSVGIGGLTSDVRIGWTGELALGALGRICEQYFEWGVREIIQQRFRTVLWPAVVLRVLRRSIMEQESARVPARSGDNAPRPSTPTRSHSKRTVPGTPQRLVNRYFGGDSDSESDRELPTAFVKSRGGDTTPRAKRRISVEGEELDTHQLLQAIRSERQHVSTDGLHEYRVEIAPGHLARLAVRQLLGTRDPALLAGTLFDLEETTAKEAGDDQDDDDDGDGATRKLKMVDPSTPLRVWVPAELVRIVHPELVRTWETRGTKNKSRTKASGSTSRKRNKDDEGPTKKAASTSKAKSKGKEALKEKPKNIPTSLSGDELEEPITSAPASHRPPAAPAPPKRRLETIRVRSVSPGLSRPVVVKSRGLPGKAPHTNSTLAAIPERSSSPTILLERSSSPPVPLPPPLPRPTKTRSAPTRLTDVTSRDSNSRIPGVEYVPTPRREKSGRPCTSDSSELEDINFRELLRRPKKRSSPELDSESEKDQAGPGKSPHTSSGSEVEVIDPYLNQAKTGKSNATGSVCRPTTRSQPSSGGSEVEILDNSYASLRPRKQKSPDNNITEHLGTESRQVRRTSREHTSPHASSASEADNSKAYVSIRKTKVKRHTRLPSGPPNLKEKSHDSVGSKIMGSVVSADVSEGIIEISSDDNGVFLPDIAKVPKATVRQASSVEKIARPSERTRLAKSALDTIVSRLSSSPLNVDTSILDLISD